MLNAEDFRLQRWADLIRPHLVRHLLPERSEIVDDHLGRAGPDDAVVLEAAEDQADRLARRADHAREIGLRDAAERDRATLVLGRVLASRAILNRRRTRPLRVFAPCSCASRAS